MKLLLFIFTIIGFASAIKLEQYYDSSCANQFQTFYFNVNDCFSMGMGANAMNYTFCNGTYFSAIIYSGTTCTGNPVLTMSGDPRVCGLERRLVYCNQYTPPSPPSIIKSASSSLQVPVAILINTFLILFLIATIFI